MTAPSTRTFILEILRRRSFKIFLSVLIGFVAASLTVYMNDFLRQLTDNSFSQKNFEKAIHICLGLLGVFFLEGIADFTHRILMRIATEETLRDLRQRVFSHMLVLSEKEGQKLSSGKATTHIVSDIASFGVGMSHVNDLVKEPLVILLSIFYLFYINVSLTIVCLVALPIIPLISGKLAKSARRNHTRYQKSIEDLSSQTVEAVRGRRTALSFGRIRELFDEFATKTEETYRYQVRLARAEEAANPATKLIATMVAAIVLVFAGYLISQNQLTLGALLAFMTTAGRMKGPLNLLNQSYIRVQQFIASGERLKNFLYQPLDSLGEAQKSLLVEERNLFVAKSSADFVSLELKDVFFSYPQREFETQALLAQALKGVSLKILKGQKIALVGRSGSGKSTLSLLAQRFMDPEQGQILLNARIATDWPLAEYRSFFSYVSQDVFLFQRSLRENFLLAKPNASDSEIFTALEQAAVLDFVKSLPRGLDTQIGELGSTLSGGEKQRMAIARAFLRNSPILILDEATSQLDSFSEAIVQKSLHDLMQNRSVLLIAHRLSTVKEADLVYVMESGRVLECGAPNELLSQDDSAFSHLWKTQFQVL